MDVTPFERIVDAFLLQEIGEEGFNRYDIIVRILAIEEHYNKNSVGFDLYNKMQKLRFEQKPTIKEAKNKDSLQKFMELIHSVEKNGYLSSKYPIELNYNGRLQNGSHRLALALYNNVQYVICDDIVDSYDFYQQVQYGLSWFVERFTIKECNFIVQRMRKLFYERGKIAYAIIWPPACKYICDIENIMLEFFTIDQCRKLEFFDRNDVHAFIEEVYAIDSYRAVRAEEKLSGDDETKKIYEVYLYQIRYYYDDPVVERSISELMDVRYQTIEYIRISKNLIRHRIQAIMKNYRFDNAFHCGQSFYENIFLQQLYERYCI